MAALISENRPTTLSSPMDGCPFHIQQYPLVCNDLFVDLTDPKSVGPLIYKIFPAWTSASIVLSGFDSDDSTTTTLSPQSPQIYKANDVSSSKVVVKRLTGGITNVLFQATYFYPATPSMTLDFSSTTKSASSPTSIGDLDSTVPSSAVTTAPSSSAASTTSTFVSDDDCLSDSTQVKTSSSYTNNHSIPSNENSITVLIRAYGNGTDTIIDRDREFATHQHLHSKSLAPQIYARFGNGLVYAYLPGRAIDYTLLSHPDVTVAVARRLAEWHNKLNAQEIESQIEALKKKQCGSTPNTFEQPFSKTLWDLLKSWIAAMPTDIITSHTKDELLDELKWIKAEIGQKGGPMVVAHCDLLAGNVIVPPQWTPRSIDTTTEPSSSSKPSLQVSFIDYEYAMNSPRAFDIANHFMEWQGFDCIKELIPEPTMDNAVIRNWARDYLSYFTQGSVNEDTVTELVSQILNWWGMPGFYWGIWSAIQSTISNIEFDYANYANERLVEYWEWKKNYLNQTKN